MCHVRGRRGWELGHVETAREMVAEGRSGATLQPAPVCPGIAAVMASGRRVGAGFHRADSGRETEKLEI